MKKTLFIIISITLIITMFGCNSAVSEKTEPHQNEQEYSAWISALKFSCIEDFITYINTGSTNPEDYIALEGVPTYTTEEDDVPKLVYAISKESFLDIRDLFRGYDDFIKDLEGIYLNEGSYYYQFKSGIIVSIKHDKEKYYSNNFVEIQEKHQENLEFKMNFRYLSLVDARNGKIDENEFIANKIGDYTVAYEKINSISDGSFAYYDFYANINGFELYISAYPGTTDGSRYDWNFDKMMSDPINKPIANLFIDGEKRDVAFMELAATINNDAIKK